MIGNTVAFLTSKDPDGRPNVMTVMPTDFVAFAPYLVGVAIKPSNFSHRCVVEAGQFGLSVPPGALAKELNYCGIVSGREIDKFTAIDLEPVSGAELDVPRLGGCIRYYECKVKEVRRYGSHDFFVAERVLLDESPDIKDAAGNYIVTEKTVPIVSYTGYDFWCLSRKVSDYTADPEQLLETIKNQRDAG